MSKQLAQRRIVLAVHRDVLVEALACVELRQSWYVARRIETPGITKMAREVLAAWLAKVDADALRDSVATARKRGRK